MKKYTISVVLNTAPDQTIAHGSDDGFGTAHSEEETPTPWREVYCHDEDCNWQVAAPAASFALVACLPNEPAGPEQLDESEGVRS